MAADLAAVRVFDLINANQIGQAEGALETALAKYPDADSVRAAEALVLLRQDQHERAKARALELSKKSIKEPKAINAVVHVLQQCCCWEALAATYERLRPLQDDTQMSENLLQTYVRMGDYAKAQQIATQLYRTHAQPKYQVWMVQACLGQVPADSKDHLMLKLAAKLLDASVLTEKGIMTPATVRTYVDVLIQQELYAEAVAVLCSERGAKIGVLETRLEVLARVLIKQRRTTLANATSRKLWSMHPDNWAPFELYLSTITDEVNDEDTHTTLELAAAKDELRTSVNGADADHTLDAALTLARTLQEAQKESRKPQRGPFLAELALLERRGDTADLQAAVLAYVKRFYRKPCCYLDVSTFLTKASADEVYEWSKEGAEQTVMKSDAEKVLAHTRRILGLRCHVASWGATPETLPDVATMRDLIAECVRMYAETKPLSVSLEWNEEGHGDSYLTVALNVALRAYVAHGKDLSWAVTALGLMQDADRRMNNSAWLLFSVCFAGLLGLTDTAAHHQLAFKSVQHDTMSHLGYWPLVRGLARNDVEAWEVAAKDYYDRVERDCSLLHAKVFTFTSWPAMQDVQRFQAKQEGSIARWLVYPHACAAMLATCQTQKNIFELLESRKSELWQAWEVLSSGKAAEELVDNTDWTVARSVVLGNIHSETVRTLTEALVDMPSVEARLTRGRQLLSSLLLLADVAAVEHKRQAAQNAPKPRKGKKGTAGTAEDGGAETLELYTSRLTEKGSKPLPDCLPAVSPLAAALVPSLLAQDEQSAAVGGPAANDAFSAYLDSLLASPTAAPFERFLYPEAYVLAALVRVVPLTKAPATVWAGTLHSCLEAAVRKYEDGSWCYTAGGATVNKAASEDAFTSVLVQEKAKRVKTYVADLIIDVAASTRRK